MTRLVLRSTWVVAAAVLNSACGNSPALSTRDSAAVVASLAGYRDAWLANDRQKVLSAISDDVVLFVPGQTSRNVVGKDSVAAFWFPRSDTQFVIRKYDITGQQVHGSGTIAVVQGKSTLGWDTVVADSVTASATSSSEFLSVLRKEDGRWRIFRQMYVLR